MPSNMNDLSRQFEGMNIHGVNEQNSEVSQDDKGPEFNYGAADL